MKKLMAVIAVVIAVLVAQVAWAEVRFESANHAVFGGKVRIEGRSAGQRCSARFDPKGVEKFTSSTQRYFESTAVLPCDLTDGGRLVLEVNGKPVGFSVPAGVITHGRTPFVVIRNGVEVLVDLMPKDTAGAIMVNLRPKAQCTMDVWSSPWLVGDTLENHRAREHSFLKEYLARHTLPCVRPYWYED